MERPLPRARVPTQWVVGARRDGFPGWVRSRWDGFNWPTLMSPSGIREPVHRATCKTIEPEEIWRVIGNYAQAARRAKEGGLDGVELSAVHQHMIDQFWSPRVNKRTDEWGGTFEGRMKFGLEVLKAVRATEALKSIPVVMLTSSQTESDVVQSYALGVNAYVVKPVDFKQFVAAIADLGVFWAVLNEPPPGSLRAARRYE